MTLPSSPLDLPPLRVTSLFPFPVEGHVVVDEEVYLRLNLGAGSPPSEDPDVQVHPWQGPFDPFLGVHTTADAKWLRANVGDDLVLIKLPLKKLPFQVGDEVRLASNREDRGTVTEVCGHGRYKVEMKRLRMFQDEMLVLDNWSTTTPMKIPTD